jgi:hypothetical protein
MEIKMKQKLPHVPFFYIIRNTENGMLYAGSRTSKYGNANPSQLLVTYNTSSTTVKNLIESGVKFEIVRIKTFVNAEETLAFEARFLRLYRCVRDNHWYNRHDGVNLAPFSSDKYLEMLQLKYGPGVTCSIHVPGVAEKISESLRGAINCWDEELKDRRRVHIEEYRANPDRYWHIQSKQYRNKYKNGAVLEKHNVRTYYNIYDEQNKLVHHKISKLEQFCESNNYPYAAIRQSADRGGERMYWTHVRVAKAGKFIRFRGWYAVRIEEDDQTTNHQPIEPVWVSKRKPREPKPKLVKLHPTVVLIMRNDIVVVMYRLSVMAAVKLLAVDHATVSKSIKSGRPLINGKPRETIATKEGKGWLIGCKALQLPFEDELVQSNLDKMVV